MAEFIGSTDSNRKFDIAELENTLAKCLGGKKSAITKKEFVKLYGDKIAWDFKLDDLPQKLKLKQNNLKIIELADTLPEEDE